MADFPSKRPREEDAPSAASSATLLDDRDVKRPRDDSAQGAAREGEDVDHLLLAAAASGAVAEVQRFLQLGAGFTAADDAGRSAMCVAAKRGDEATLRALLSSPAAAHVLNAVDSYELTPLMHVVAGGHTGAMEVLLQAGADVCARGSSPNVLWEAVHTQRVDMLKRLLPLVVAAGGLEELNTQDELGSTLLQHVFADQRDAATEMCEILLAAGAVVDVPDMNGCTALHDAVQCNALPALALLLRHGASHTSTCSKCGTPLMRAVCLGLEDVVALLIDAGADVNASTFDDEGDPEYTLTPLMASCKSRCEKVTLRLLAAGADVRLNDSLGQTVLHIVAYEECVSLISPLVAHGALFDVIDDEDSETPLSSAAACGHMEVCRELLACGASVHAFDDLALRSAAAAGRTTVCIMLLDAGADMLAHNEDDHCALIVAAAGGRLETCVALLHRMPADVPVPILSECLESAAKHGNVELCTILRDHGAELSLSALKAAAGAGCVDVVAWMLPLMGDADLNELPDANMMHARETALHSAAAGGHTQVCIMLMDAGVDADVRSVDKRETPLMRAAENGHASTCAELLARGASVLAMDAAGVAPLSKAAKRGRIAAARVLVACQARLEAEDQTGRRALHHAAEAGRHAMCTYLLSVGASVNARISHAGDMYGRTPLICAAAVASSNARTVMVLISHGANVNTATRRGPEGATALSIAAGARRWAVCAALLRSRRVQCAVPGNATGMAALCPAAHMVAELKPAIAAEAFVRRAPLLYLAARNHRATAMQGGDVSMEQGGGGEEVHRCVIT